MENYKREILLVSTIVCVCVCVSDLHIIMIAADSCSVWARYKTWAGVIVGQREVTHLRTHANPCESTHVRARALVLARENCSFFYVIAKCLFFFSPHGGLWLTHFPADSISKLFFLERGWQKKRKKNSTSYSPFVATFNKSDLFPNFSAHVRGWRREASTPPLQEVWIQYVSKKNPDSFKSKSTDSSPLRK